MIRIDKKLALKLLQDATEAKGYDYVDPNSRPSNTEGCVYTKNGAPSCIVGHVMVAAGVPVDALGNGGDVWDLMRELDEEEVAYVSQSAGYVLGEAQSFQDRGCSWGEALAAVKESW